MDDRQRQRQTDRKEVRLEKYARRSNVAHAHHILVFRHLLLALEERVDIGNLQLADAISMSNDLLHLLVMRLERLD